MQLHRISAEIAKVLVVCHEDRTVLLGSSPDEEIELVRQPNLDGTADRYPWKALPQTLG